MNHKLTSLFSILCLLIGLPSSGQNIKDLTALIQVKDTLYYEQWLNRDHWKYGNLISKNSNLIVPTISGVPIGIFSKKADSTWTIFKIDKKTKLPKYKAFRDYKFDFWIQPDWQFQFGNFEKAVESKGGISLYHQMPLFRGLSLFGGIHFPITNDLDEQPLNIRPAALYLNYLKSIGKFNYLNLASGYFLGDRYGYKIQYIHSPLNGLWSWGLENSYTGYMYFFPKNLKYTNLNDMLAIAHLAYRIKKEDITIKLTGGQFLYKDKGIRLEAIRQFTKAEISLFSLFSKNGSTIGVDIAFRLPPGKIVQSKKIRVRSGAEYPFQYVYSRGYGIADNFRLLTDLDRTLRQMNGHYWSNESKRSK